MKKLYETDSMRSECSAKICSCRQLSDQEIKERIGAARPDAMQMQQNGRKPEFFEITLDPAIFFPEGGGQYADHGTILYQDREYSLIDGQERLTADGGNQEIVYLIAAAVTQKDQKNAAHTSEEPGAASRLPVGASVLCKLDWRTRFSRMQQHSGEHILSGLIHRRFGYENVSFHLSDEEPVIVCFSGTLTDEETEAIEREVNEVIYRNLPIIDTYPAREELASIRYRSKIEIKGQVRLVTVGTDEMIDRCACCAPHLPSTAYVGILKIISSQSYKGGTQLNILCGMRAFDYMQKEHAMISALSHAFSTSIDALPELFAAQREKLNAAEAALGNLREEALQKQVAALDPNGPACIFADDLSNHAMKVTYNALAAKCSGFCGVFNGNDETGYRFYAGNPSLDSTELARKMRSELSARGGGSREMIQGQLSCSAAEIRAFFHEL